MNVQEQLYKLYFANILDSVSGRRILIVLRKIMI